jgi:flagellin-like hook-associated protein FlgL
MDVNKLGATQMLVDYRSYSKRLVGAMDRLSTGKRAASPKDNPILWGEVERLKLDATALSGYSDNLHRGASSVRIALGSMELAQAHLLQSEEKLNAAFAAKAGSEERANALKAYNELLAFVDDSAEAPDAGARRLLDDPLRYADAGNLEIRAGENGFKLIMKSREIHTGATGLDIPRAGAARPSEFAADPLAPPVIADLNNATNAEIAKMIEFSHAAKSELVARVKALSVDATSIEDSEAFNEAFVTRNERQADSINVADLNAEAVLAQSLQIKGQLSISGLSGTNDTYRIVLQLIK